MNAILMRICAILLSIFSIVNSNHAQTNVSSPIPSLKSGLYRNSVTVTLFTSTPSASVYYTTDGAEPTEQSLKYTIPLTFTQNTPLRAKAFAAGLTASATTTNTYFINVSHTFPIVALSFNEADFFDPAKGIYPNFEKSLTAAVNIEFFESDGTLKFAQGAEAAIQGTTSSLNAQKSLEIKSKKGERFPYRIFPDLPFEDYNVFVLRNAGQDWNVTMFRDAFVSSLVRDISDIKANVTPPQQLTQGYRPSIVYFNGKYWGIHNIRERMNKRYVEQHFGLKDTEYDLVENWAEAKVGDTKEWENFYSLFSFMNFDSDANYDIIKQKIDIPSFIDYHVFNVIIDNNDWPSNNNRRFRLRNANGKWRWMTFDLDFTFGLYQAFAWNTGDPTQNSMVRLMDANFKGWPNADYSTLIFRKLMDNQRFRRDFYNRMSDYLNVFFNPTRVNARIAQFESLYAPEIQQHDARWALSTTPWRENVQKLRRFANERVPIVKKQMVDYFGDILGTANLTTVPFPLNTGDVLVNTAYVNKSSTGVTAAYFTGIDIPILAVPAQGYEFAGWSDPALGSSPNAIVRLNGDKGIFANFRPISTTPQAVVINEISYDVTTVGNDWIELHNPNAQSVNLSGWSITTNLGHAITFPLGTIIPANDYLVVAEDLLHFETIYPNIKKVIAGDFTRMLDVKFNIAGGVVTLKNSLSGTIDEATFTGAQAAASDKKVTFQLTLPQANNLQAANWTPQQGTPAEKNINGTVVIAPPTTPTATIPPAIISTPNSTLPVGYCTVQTSAPWDEWIGGVKFGGIHNLTSKTQYFKYENLRPEVIIGTANEIKLTASFLSLPYPEAWRVWIDYNRNGVFEANEKAWEATVAAPPRGYTVSSVTSSITIPSTAQAGLTLMRVAMKRNAFAEACENFQYGEIEDYVLLLKEGAGNTIANPTQTTPPPTPAPTTIPPPTTPAGAYCMGTSTNPWEQWISRVTLANMNNPSSKALTNNFTNISTVIEKNKDYDLTLTTGFSYTTYAEYWQVWVDFNKDNDFEDAGELLTSFVTSKPARGTAQWATTVAMRIPSGVTTGNMRMRVSMNPNGYVTPCTVISAGEMEDYTLNVVETQTNLTARSSQVTNVQFESNTVDKSVLLFWNVASYKGIQKIEVERMEDGQTGDFSTIFTQNFAQPTANPGFYQTNDMQPKEGTNYYRLHVSFADGSSVFSAMRQANFSRQSNFNVYPNPTSNSVNLQLRPWVGLEVTARIYDMMGKLITEHPLGVIEKNAIELDVSEMQEGAYMIHLSTIDRPSVSKLLMITE
jgi:CotH kinase protein/Chitobiase/beta-hexosaminidase C-terminal domain/GEVED domain/Lamin Tail Domain/Secretion system C-terminal sorting domain/Divergent InlB B-repeat domain